MSWLSIVLPAFVPVLTDAVRGLVGKLTGGAGAQPQNVAEAIQLMQAQTERVKAMAELDRPSGDVSRWVSDVRAIYRYAAITLILSATAGAVAGGAPEFVILAMLDMSGACMSFIIGERMYLRLKA